MTLKFEPGNCQPKEMDEETQHTIIDAIVKVSGEEVKGRKGCHLCVVPGRNLAATQIEIREKATGLVVAFYSNGIFYDAVSKKPIELVHGRQEY